MRTKRSILRVTTAMTAAMVFGQPALAMQPQNDSVAAASTYDGEIADIVVTAQRRSERLQEVPLAVSAIDGSQLVASGVVGSLDLKLVVPSADVPVTNGYATPFIRGVGSRAVGPGVESPIATYVDGVYIGASAAALLNFSNIERIEVLNGPQGTLFGRNATGGLIQVVTRDPGPDFGGEVSVGYGNYDSWTSDLYLTAGLGEGIAADIAAFGNFQGDGYGTNLFNGEDVYRTKYDYGIRTKWLIEPNEGLQIRLAGDFSKFETSSHTQRVTPGATPPALFGAAYGGSPWDTDLDVQPLLRHQQGGASMRIDADLGSMAFISTTAYREADYFNDFDADITATDGRRVTVTQNDRQFSQEFQLQSVQGSPVDWVMGLFYWNAKGEYDPSIVTLNGVARPPAFSQIVTLGYQKTESIAPYAQVSVPLSSATKVTFGLRYTYESREHAGSQTNLTPSGSIAGTPIIVDRSTDVGKVTWRVALNHEFSDDVMAYVSSNRGFKSGGYAISNITFPAYQPETLDSYEIGLKTLLLDRKLRFNAAAFYYDYKDVQTLGNSGGQLFISNGGKAEIKGFEFDLTARPASGLVINMAYTYLDSEWKRFDGSAINVPNPAGGKTQVFGSVAGNALPNAPKHTFSVSGTYSVPVGENELSFNANYYYNDGYFGEPDNVTGQSSYGLLNGSIRFALADDRFSLSVWGRNLTDKAVNIYPSHIAVGGGASIERANYAPPRTYGISLGSKF